MAKVRLGDVAREYKEICNDSKDGYPIVGLEHLIPQEVKLTEWDEGNDNTFTKMFCEGQMLFGRRRAYLKKAAVAPFDGICSGDITVIEAIEDKLLPELLPFIIQNDSLFDFAVENSAGSLSPRVKWEHLSNYEFNLPPIEEQPKLAETLWAFENTKEAYKRLLAKTDELVKAQFIEMFGDFRTNPKGIEIKAIGDLFTVGSSKRVFQKDWCSEGVPFYRAREIVKLSEVGYVNNELFITPEMYEEYAEKYGVPAIGDIMVTGVGTLGICYLVKEKDKFYYKDGNTICLHNLGKILSRFVIECYKMPFIREQIEEQSTGTTVGTYTIENANKTKIFVPSIHMQKVFVGFVESVDNTKLAIQQSLDSLEQCRNALMEKAFG